MSEPKLGDLKGIGLRPDPQGILFAPFTDDDGVQFGYTIIDPNQKPSMFMEDGWKEFVPEGVWLQMVDNWNAMKAGIRENLLDFPEYLQYPELKALSEGK